MGSGAMKLKAGFAVLALPLVAACVPPQGVTAEDMLAFDEAVTSIGCTLATETDYLPVELQTGMTREKVIEVAQYKVSRQEAVSLDNGGVRLVTGACTPKAEAPAA